MATTPRSQAISTPKPHPTPSRLMASPRPGTSGNASRPLAYKSPAVKTPASAQGHGHHVSVSSQPSSTPLAAVAIHDELLALNSPAAALMASIGPTGLTPLPSGADGLGITTNLPGNSVRPSATSVNPEMERLHRLQLVADTLKSRVSGYGVTREGVERTAQLHGFDTAWDDDNLTIAGIAVELEVMFDSIDRDHVKDVSLKLNAPDSEEPQLLEQGTDILKQNLEPSITVKGIPQWKGLDTFQSNLQYLSQLDRIEGGVPCFQAINSLYNAFQKIWTAEKERFNGRSVQQRLRRGAIGRPALDQEQRLGLSVDYWVGGQAMQQEAVGPPGGEQMHTARFFCDPGTPSTVLTKEWISDRVLIENIQAEGDASNETPQPDWKDPANDANEFEKAGSDEPAMERTGEISSNVLNMHFACSLSPTVYVPINVAATLNVEMAMFEMNQELAITSQMILQEHFNASKVGGAKTVSEERWLRCLPAPMEGDPLRYRRHSYALHSAQHAAALWCYPVTQLSFNHPRHFAAAIPILRQYALVWSLLRSLVNYGEIEPSHQLPTARQKQPPVTNKSGRPSKRSNAKVIGVTLDTIVGTNGSKTDNDDVLPVDVSLDVFSDISKARLDVFAPFQGKPATSRQGAFLFLSVNICRDGIIEVNDLKGLHPSVASSDQIVRILTATEDIGLLVEWLLERTHIRG
ncbi:mediator of RNA polymerase II transcription subunit 1-domain-containing protein [Exophiala viscosa]|uniref:Mediator of RNA polymerase II transcription subunit 1 n=1 Tax=Exophiala viscosa TaxID=2486360 RepID=A0AAN6DP97_9EURO|nr:mediator of RNA polymerase II transcription subunit 1-domain-containing protein [Exophiala viscosa]KAI1620875.1 mediator of RNA polymerase II transcription subunit 1-domain-containing protein [Exophiala viscosa]